jgi:hypothetical protein
VPRTRPAVSTVLNPMGGQSIGLRAVEEPYHVRDV